MLLAPLFLDLDDLTQRDREAEFAKIRSRRVARDQMRSTYRKRRAIAVAVLAVPIAAFVFAGRFPSDSKKADTRQASAVATTAAAAPATTADPGPTRFPAPSEVRAAHFSMYLANDQNAVQKYIDAYDADKGLNAVELDIKNENGDIGFTEDMPSLAVKSGSAHDFYEPRVVVDQFHQAGLYVIGRIVSFEDDHVSHYAPKRAIRREDGTIWENHIGLGWMNPYDKANWKYLVSIAKAAGKVGFDEIQFDYVRFPTDGDLTNVKLNRSSPKMESTIAGFLKYAVGELHPLKLRVSADLFGLAATRDLGIGQNPRQLRDIVDVMSPMIYPQGYGSGEYGIDCPVCNPHDTIEATMADWKKAAVNGTAELRPWIQAYDWLDHPYGSAQVQAQVSAVRDFTNRGFLLWNPKASYDAGMLQYPAVAAQ
jgi:hypothetical protein